MIKMMPGKIAVAIPNKTNNKDIGYAVVANVNAESKSKVAFVAEDVDTVEVGQVVYFHKDKIRVNIDGVEYFIMNVDNVLAIDA